MLWSRNPSGVSFDDDHGITLTIIAGNGNNTILNSNSSEAASLSLSNESNAKNPSSPSLTTSRIEMVKFGRLQFPSNGTIGTCFRITPAHYRWPCFAKPSK